MYPVSWCPLSHPTSLPLILECPSTGYYSLVSLRFHSCFLSICVQLVSMHCMFPLKGPAAGAVQM